MTMRNMANMRLAFLRGGVREQAKEGGCAGGWLLEMCGVRVMMNRQDERREKGGARVG
jgi:hypothetical protein